MEQKKQRIKKEYSTKGGRTQKLISFRADFDVVAILEEVTNKGRLLNNLVKEWAQAKNRDESREEFDPSSQQIEDYEQ